MNRYDVEQVAETLKRAYEMHAAGESAEDTLSFRSRKSPTAGSISQVFPGYGLLHTPRKHAPAPAV